MGTDATKVYVCAGKDCRKHKADRKKLRRAVARVGTEVPVRCQKICKGPVLGLRVGGTVQWFGKVRGGRIRRALLTFLETGVLPRELSERVQTKRRGKLRT